MKFQRSIGSIGLLLAGVSSIIGSGWLFGPLYAAQIAGPAAILTWIVGASLMTIIALTFAELGSAFPVAGGMVQFAHHSHGPLIGFITGWMVWISSIAVAPVETMALLQYAANYIPGLIIKVENTHLLTHIGMIAAAIILFFMAWLNYYSAAFFSRANGIITVIKLVVPCLTILVLLATDFHSNNFTAAQSGGFIPFGWHGVLAALPLGGVIYSFIGSNAVLQLAGETKNPQRSIPLALIGSILLCMVLYVLLQITFIGAISPDAILHGWGQLHYEGDSGPFAGIMAALGLGWFVIIINADALISPFGTGFVFTAATARVSYGLSEVGFLPQGLKKLSAKGTPVRCMILNYFVGLLLFLPFPGWQKLASFIISCFILSYIIGPLALVGLRKSQPDQPRPFKLPYANFMALCAFYICNLLIYWTGWDTVSKMMITIFLGLIFFMGYCWHAKQNLLQEWRKAWWILPYFAGMTVISYMGSFGNGHQLIAFGWDFVWVGLLTLTVFYWVTAQKR